LASTKSRSTQAIFTRIKNLDTSKGGKIMSEVVWSVNILLAIGLVGTAYVLYYILTLDENEEKNSTHSHSSKTNK
jgi:hypothetical protein